MIKRILSNELAKGSFILLILINVFNIINYLFQFSMARLLGPADFRIIAAMMSLIYIFSVPSEAIQTIISRYASKYNLSRELGRMKNLLVKGLKKGFLLALVSYLIFSVLAIFLAEFIRVDYWIIELTGIVIFGSFLMPVLRGVLQGQKKFASLGGSLIIEAGIRLVLAVLLVVAGFGVFGAVWGIVIATVLGFLVIFVFMKRVIRSDLVSEKVEGIYRYSLPVFITILVIVLMYSLDVWFANRFFSVEEAGVYAVVSTLGKMIFFGTVAISKAMFPLASEGHEAKRNTKRILKKALIIIVGISLVAIFLFLVFPKLIIGILFGEDYISGYSILVYIGIGFSLLSITNLVLMYGLSTNKVNLNSLILFLFLLIQILLFLLFHGNLFEFSIAFLSSNILMLIGSLVITWK
ncbi:MAG: oligosaccharide flippase family protein [archaeon]